ncbi:MAG: hypothetical protein ACKVUS_16705 [Saprospiraceae bacterium]
MYQEAQKLELIRDLSNEEDTSTLEAVATYYHALKVNRQELRKKYVRSARKRLDPEMLKQRQGFKGHDHAKIMAILQNVDIPESIETLLGLQSK